MMKKILFMSLMILTASVCRAEAKSKASFGVLAGVNQGNLDGAIMVMSGSSPRITLTGGVYCSVGGDHVRFQPEVLYAPQGAKMFEGVLSLDYLELPLLVKFLLGTPGSSNRVHLLLGPSIGLLLSAKIKEDGSTEDIKDQFNGANLALSGGIGIESGKFSLDAVLSTGLSDLLKDSAMEGNFRVGSLRLLAGYRFN